jgi:PAS domain S-box-containing protein
MSRRLRPRSLTRQTLARVALRFTLVAAGAAVLSYYHVLDSLRSQALEQLEKYVEERGVRESTLFLLAEDNLHAFSADYAGELAAKGQTDPERRFAALFERLEDGTLRLRERYFHRDRITGLVGKYIALDADLRRRLVLGFELLGRFGPAWRNRFVNLYLTTPENAVMMYWPGKPWALSANSWEVQAKLPARSLDGVKVLGIQPGQEAQTSWSEPYFDYAANDWVVSVSEPVHVGKRHIATVAHDILLHDLIARTLDESLPGTYNLVLSRAGHLIAHPRLMDAIRAQGGRFSIPDSGDAELERIFREVGEQNAPVSVRRDPEGAAYLAVTQIAGPPWYLITVFPESIVTGRAFATARLVLGLAALALAMEIVVLWLVFRRQIARPLGRLTAATERLADGDYQVRLAEQPDNELGRLAQSFNLMSGEIQRTMERLKETTVSRTYLDSIIQNSGEGIVTLDEQGCIISVNRAAEETFGFRADEAVGVPAARLLDERVAARFADWIDLRDGKARRFAASGHLRGLELPARRWDGRPFPVELTVTQTLHEGRRLRICIVRDVSLRKQTEAALRQAKEAAEAANRAKSEFLANMSHELRTPLNSVLGYAQILQRQEGLSVKQRRLLGVIEQSGEHLLGLIEEVLDMAKVEAGALELRPAPFDLTLLIASVRDSLGTRARQKGLAFRIEQPPDLPDWVRGDARRLRQVLMNLLDNAVKYTETGGVTLRVCRQGERLAFEVEDTGVGIVPEELDAIFDTFHRVRRPGTFQDGAGLGLAICRQLTALMGGELRVDSRPGAGSRFRLELTLPAAYVQRGAPRSLEVPLRAVDGGGRRILIADDREDNRRLLREMLEPNGFEIREAADGEDCLREALAWRPDCILVDLKMPRLDGDAVIRRARASQTLRETLIIAISASVFGEHREQSIEAGADAFLPKPVRLDALLDLLHRRLGLGPIPADPANAAAPTGPPAGPPAERVAQTPPLPGEAWRLLTELARRGDIQGLRQRLGQLAEEDPRFGPLAEELCALADRFRMRRIRERLEGLEHAP